MGFVADTASISVVVLVSSKAQGSRRETASTTAATAAGGEKSGNRLRAFEENLVGTPMVVLVL